VNKISPSKKDRRILSSVKNEMQKPRQTASVRDSQEAEAAQAAKVRAAHTARA
jgi:hypothetical protein